MDVLDDLCFLAAGVGIVLSPAAWFPFDNLGQLDQREAQDGQPDDNENNEDGNEIFRWHGYGSGCL